jgi:hypothetical protein
MNNLPEQQAMLALKAKLDNITRNNRKGKHDNGRPLRPLSAYNIFFQMQRNKLMEEQSKPGAKHVSGGFENLVSSVL